jgi:hypothetical protein
MGKAEGWKSEMRGHGDFFRSRDQIRWTASLLLIMIMMGRSEQISIPVGRVQISKLKNPQKGH